MDWASYLAAAGTAYLVGSVPTGYLAGRMRGIDIRTVGSGNIGATNVFRALGKRAGIAVLLIDALKGYAACRWVGPAFHPLWGGDPLALQIVAGTASVLGHNFTCWLRFKGGKGVATSAGVLAAWNGMGFLITLGVWALVFALSRIVSLASIFAAVALPFAFWLAGAGPALTGITLLLAALALYKHRPNIRRLIEGTEPRVGRRKQT